MKFPEAFDYVKQELDKTGVWEPRTTEYINNYLKKGQTFYDVGAQVGYFSKLASDLGAKVIAFEPCKNNGVYLQENCPDINIIDVALSDFNGQTRLFTGKTPGENSLLENYHNGCGSELVMANRFDDLLLDIPDMIKMDIEGGERKALLGMESIITTNKPITLIFEDWDNKNTDWLVDTYGWNLVTTDRASGNRILTKNMDYEYVEEPIRCHLLGTFNAPNTLRDEGIGNAFGTKVINMAKILRKLGHYIIFYGIEGSDVECDEFVQVSTMDVLRQTYGEWDNTKIYSEKYDDFSHKTFNENCIREINARKRNGDFLLLCHGTFHKQIADAVQIPETIEIGIGHRSSFARFRVFESQMQMNWTYGKEDKGDGNFYDCVIPGFFDPDDFEYSEDKEDYFLYLGRVITKKGIFVAQQVCQVLGKKLVVAGFGYTKEANETDYNSFKSLLEMPNIEYVGFAGKEKRKNLMAHAKALFLPTLYLEPFGYVVIEANMSGTPVITSPFGAFVETVKDGYNGYKCWTHREFVEAARNIENIKPSDCREWAMQYTLDKTAPMYKRYFTQILGLIGKGWYS